MAIKQVSLAHVARLMKEGYVRFKKDDDGNGVGNIEEELGLSPAALKEIYAHEKIKGIRIKVPTYKLIDDYNPEDDIINLVDDIENTSENYPVTPQETTSAESENTTPTVDEQLNEIVNQAEEAEAELFA